MASSMAYLQIHLSELDEINAGVCDGATYDYIKKYMPYVHYNRKKDKLGYRYPSGESYIDLCKRVWPIMQKLRTHGGSKLIVGHQAVLRCMFGYLEKRPLYDITHLVRFSSTCPTTTALELGVHADMHTRRKLSATRGRGPSIQGRDLKTARMLQSVPHHQVFQFTVYPDGTITRKDFHMDLVADPAQPERPLPGWPFDVSHSRPLTDTDIARYSPKPKVPLLISRVVSLAQVDCSDHLSTNEAQPPLARRAVASGPPPGAASAAAAAPPGAHAAEALPPPEVCAAAAGPAAAAAVRGEALGAVATGGMPMATPRRQRPLLATKSCVAAAAGPPLRAVGDGDSDAALGLLLSPRLSRSAPGNLLQLVDRARAEHGSPAASSSSASPRRESGGAPSHSGARIAFASKPFDAFVRPCSPPASALCPAARGLRAWLTCIMAWHAGLLLAPRAGRVLPFVWL